MYDFETFYKICKKEAKNCKINISIVEIGILFLIYELVFKIALKLALNTKETD